MSYNELSSENTRLIDAAIAGDCASVRSAVTTANVNATDENGWTSLHIAVHSENREMVLLLLSQQDINVNATNKWHSTPLIIAAGGGNLDIVEILLRHPGILVDFQAEYYGRTALMESAVRGHAHIARCLVRYGADVNVSDKTGRSNALIEAIKNRHPDIAIFLLRTGIIDFSNQEMRLQALVWASRSGQKLYRELDHAIAAFYNRTGGKGAYSAHH